MSRKQLARIIDHTLVKPTATKDAVIELCREAEKYGFRCVCVNSAYVPLAVQLLKGTDVKVCSTVGFPFGAALAEVKAFEAKRAVENGASEVDMVMNIGALKSGDYDKVKEDIKAVVDVKRLYGDVLVKVIIETGYLTDEEKIKACELAKEAGADFVKTSTGLVGGATVEDVRLMRETVGEGMGVKAAGGIRDFQQALAMIEAGADRIGTSTAVAVIETRARTPNQRRA
ncbi:MAG: deoxyribose-phosphate aldolase [Candidatus Bathyarchaeia archaeon]